MAKEPYETSNWQVFAFTTAEEKGSLDIYSYHPSVCPDLDNIRHYNQCPRFGDHSIWK